jgi:tripartite ATP-independent transporter DctM subunit
VAAWGVWRGTGKAHAFQPWARAGAVGKWEWPASSFSAASSAPGDPVEAALAVVYALVVVTLLFRELRTGRDLLRIAVESATMVGGFMIILSVALGLTNYLIIAQVPMQALSWVKAFIESPILFLLALNALLIVVGALMDIYSAIIIIVPLIAPMAAAYGINPVHLGVIFLANMQLGYLMPPMGENLFLSAYRFDRPLPQVYRATIPYVVILAVTILLITYLPWLTLAPLELVGWRAPD